MCTEKAHMCGILSTMQNSPFRRKYLMNLIEDSLQNNRVVLFNSIKIMKDKERLKNGHRGD